MMNKKDKEKCNTGNKLLQQRNALLWKRSYKMKSRKTPPNMETENETNPQEACLLVPTRQ
jgi:hypothetical protein